MGEEDDGLAERFRAGGQDALRLAYDRYAGAVYHLALRSLHSSADAEDVTQATFVAAWQGRETFDESRGSLLGWLLGIARRKIVDRVRAAGRENRLVESVRALPPPAHSAPEQDRVIDRLVLADALSRLPDEQRRVGAGVLRRPDPSADLRDDRATARHGQESHSPGDGESEASMGGGRWSTWRTRG